MRLNSEIKEITEALKGNMPDVDRTIILQQRQVLLDQFMSLNKELIDLSGENK